MLLLNRTKGSYYDLQAEKREAVSAGGADEETRKSEAAAEVEAMMVDQDERWVQGRAVQCSAGWMDGWWG